MRRPTAADADVTDTHGPGLSKHYAGLADDLHYFPPYFAAPVVRDELLAKAPEVGEILNRPAGKLDDRTMAELNYEVSGKKRAPEEVAREFLRARG